MYTISLMSNPDESGFSHGFTLSKHRKKERAEESLKKYQAIYANDEDKSVVMSHTISKSAQRRARQGACPELRKLFSPFL